MHKIRQFTRYEASKNICVRFEISENEKGIRMNDQKWSNRKKWGREREKEKKKGDRRALQKKSTWSVTGLTSPITYEMHEKVKHSSTTEKPHTITHKHQIYNV